MKSVSQKSSFAGYLYKKKGSAWQRLFFSLSDCALLMYAAKSDASSLCGYVDRAAILGSGAMGEEKTDAAGLLYTFTLDIGEEAMWTLGASKSKTRAAFLAGLHTNSPGTSTPPTFRKAQARSAANSPKPGRAVFQSENASSKPAQEPLELLARSLSVYESEFDQTGGTESQRGRKLEQMLDGLLENDVELKTVKPSIMDELEREIAQLLASDGVEAVRNSIRSSVRRTLSRGGRNATMGAVKFRNSIVDTMARKPKSGKGKTALAQIDWKMAAAAPANSEEDEEEEESE